MTKLLATIFIFATIHSLGQIKGVKKFNLEELGNKRLETNQRWLQFLDEPTMEAGIYHLDKNSNDPQPVHELDEIYYILKGEAHLQAGDTSFQVNTGSIVYVRAHIKHYFLEIKSDLDVLVLFPKTKPSESDIARAQYHLKEIETSARPAENIWNPFHQSTTMKFGLYMLPKKLNGDSTLTHKVDELNIIVKGQSKFSVNGIDMNVNQGDIIFVAKGHGHYFHNLKSDLEAFILFENRSLQK